MSMTSWRHPGFPSFISFRQSLKTIKVHLNLVFWVHLAIGSSTYFAQENPKPQKKDRQLFPVDSLDLRTPKSPNQLQLNPFYSPSTSPIKMDSLNARLVIPSPFPYPLQRSSTDMLPYPIIFVHGLNGTSSTWSDFLNWMDPAVKLGSNLNFCLNDDGNFATSNLVYDLDSFLPLNLGNADLYKVNFNCGSSGTCSSVSYSNLSNQSAIFKQGAAIGLAVDAVLNATGKEKVILVGHSCGGLAIREYFQNSTHWIGNNHNVAKLVTVGTPNLGSDFSIGILDGLFSNYIDVRSEAVRDLRNSYFYTSNAGVYLFGGPENLSYMDDMLLYYFYNSDVNCNGYSGNSITGLNERTIDGAIDFATVYDTSDLIVGLNQIMYYYASDNSGGENFCTFADANYTGSWSDCESFAANPSGVDGGHMALVEETMQIISSLDEADDYDRAYRIVEDKTYAGFFTAQSPAGPYVWDWDDYLLTVESAGTLVIDWSLGESAIGAFLYVYDLSSSMYLTALEGNSANQLLELDVVPGDYIIEFSRLQNSSFSQYWFNVQLQTIACPGGDTYCGEGTFWDVTQQMCVGEPDSCASDINDDSTVTVSDLLLLLSDFGQLCPD